MPGSVRTLGVIPAGGMGARLGRGPKALVEFGGQPLLVRAVTCMRLCCDRVVVSAPAGLLRSFGAVLAGAEGVELVADAPDGGGPLAGVVAGLAAIPCERAIVLGVDFPLARPAALAAIAGLIEMHPQRGVHPLAVVPAPGGVPQPLCAAYAPEACGLLAASYAAGARAMHEGIAAIGRVRLLGDAEIAALEGGAENVINVNTQASLDAALALARDREQEG